MEGYKFNGLESSFMKFGLYLRNMGPQSTRETVLQCAQHADEAGIDDLWVADHIAIHPEHSEGSGGRYLDPLATLAFLAGTTSRINIGPGVLVLPYRPALVTAKWIATIQELCGGRLLFGAGVGWMDSEFRIVGEKRSRRGRVSDETLAYLLACFADDEMQANGERFLFLPRPERPPIYIGGSAQFALDRVVRFGEGWMPMRIEPDALEPQIDRLNEQMHEAGKPAPQIAPMVSLDLNEPGQSADKLNAYSQAGATRMYYAWRYADAKEFMHAVDVLVTQVRPRLD